MSSKRCDACGLVNFIEASECKRCGATVFSPIASDTQSPRSTSFPGPPQSAPLQPMPGPPGQHPAPVQPQQWRGNMAPPPYEYKMIQIPPSITVQAGREQGNEYAIFLQNIANEQAAQGWEFYRVDTAGVYQQPGGCLGGAPTFVNHYVVTFRRRIG